MRCAERHQRSHEAKVFSKLVQMVRIENLVSRTIFENRNLLKSRVARGASNSFSQTLVFEKRDGCIPERCTTKIRVGKFGRLSSIGKCDIVSARRRAESCPRITCSFRRHTCQISAGLVRAFRGTMERSRRKPSARNRRSFCDAIALIPQREWRPYARAGSCEKCFAAR